MKLKELEIILTELYPLRLRYQILEILICGLGKNIALNFESNCNILDMTWICDFQKQIDIQDFLPPVSVILYCCINLRKY